MVQRGAEREGGRLGAGDEDIYGLGLLQVIRQRLEVVKHDGQAGARGPAGVVVVRARGHLDQPGHLPECRVEVSGDREGDPSRGEPLHGAVVPLVRHLRGNIEGLEKFRVKRSWVLIGDIGAASKCKFSNDVNCHASSRERCQHEDTCIPRYVDVPSLEWMTLPEGIPDSYRTDFGDTPDLRLDLFQLFYHERFQLGHS